MSNGKLAGRGAWLLGVWLLTLGAGVVQLRGEIVVGPEGDEILNPQQVELVKTLSPEYKDEVHGFRICPPAGARIIQQSGLESNSERLNFVVDAKQWLGTVQSVFFKPKTFTPEEYLKSAAKGLNDTYKAVQILESRTTTCNDKAAAQMTASVEVVGKIEVKEKGAKKTTEKEVGTATLLKQELAVQVATNEYLVLTLYGPLVTKEEMIKTFEAMVGTFVVYDRAQIDKRRLDAIKAGKEWIQDRVAEELTKRLVDGLQVFRIKVEGKDVGYLSFEEKVDTYLGFKGISVYVNSRTFPQDGLVGMSKSQAFWAFARQDSRPNQITQYSMWENSAKNVSLSGNHSSATWTSESGNLQFEIPAVSPDQPDGGKDRPNGEIRGGHFVLTVSREVGNDMGILTDNSRKPMVWPISYDKPSPLPKVLEYLWPRVLDLSKPQKCAFAVFNSGQNRMGLRTLSVLGPETIVLDGKPVKTTHLLDEIAPGSTNVWVDSNGRIVMMRTSDSALLVPTTLEKMTHVWNVQIKRMNSVGGPAR